MSDCPTTSAALRRTVYALLIAIGTASVLGRGVPSVEKLAGSVAARQERKSAKGNRFAFVSLSDPTGLYEVTVFSDVLEACRDHLEPGKNVVLTVSDNAGNPRTLTTSR